MDKKIHKSKKVKIISRKYLGALRYALMIKPHEIISESSIIITNDLLGISLGMIMAIKNGISLIGMGSL